jgi:hypothetical protein
MVTIKVYNSGSRVVDSSSVIEESWKTYYTSRIKWYSHCSGYKVVAEFSNFKTKTCELLILSAFLLVEVSMTITCEGEFDPLRAYKLNAKSNPSDLSIRG